LLEIGFLGMRFSLNYELGQAEEEEIARTEVSASGPGCRLNPFLDANGRKWIPGLSADPL